MKTAKYGPPGAASAFLFMAVATCAWARVPDGPTPIPPVGEPVGVASVPDFSQAAPAMAPAPVPVLPLGTQVVRFQVPEGVRVEVLNPAPVPIAINVADGANTVTVGLRVGSIYWLRLSNLPGNPDAVLYPTLEMTGHLHVPNTIDPGRFPVRVVFRFEDLTNALLRGRMTTQVVYLEDPEQAIPISFPKDELPWVDLAANEDPIKVAAALGRVMAIARIGGRTPTAEELAVPPGTSNLLRGPCPFASTGNGGTRCGVPLGPVHGCAPPPNRLWIPRDEFLCDGGDHNKAMHFGGDGSLAGIDPRDAAIQFSRPSIDQLVPELEKIKERFDRGEITSETFQIESNRLQRSAVVGGRPRVLPTNVVCIYAPRFATVRAGIGPNEALAITPLQGAERVERQVQSTARLDPIRLTQNVPPGINRSRVRASAAVARVALKAAHEVRVLQGTDIVQIPGGTENVQGPQTRMRVQGPGKLRTAEGAVAIESMEGVVVQARPAGPGQTLMSWKPQETAGTEVPPNQPGLAVLKRASESVAEPGQKITFSIQYRNMGNVPLSDVSIIDSLLPRFAYVLGTAQGPKGAVFTATENRAGGMELRWDLPGLVDPGAEGWVSFEVEVR